MTNNYSMTKMSVVLGAIIIALVMPGYIDGMKTKVFSENEVAKIRATFVLGEMYILGEDCEKDLAQAQEYFNKVVDAAINNEVSAWSFIWLAKINIYGGNKKKGDIYLEKAMICGREMPFIWLLVTFLRKPDEKGFGKHVFFQGVQECQIRVLQFLLACGVEIDFSESLLCATLMGYKDFYEFWHCIGKDKNIQLSFNGSLESGYESIIGLLLDKGADSKVQGKNGFRPLHHASASGLISIVQLMLDMGADIAAKTKDGCTALHYAIWLGHKDIVELLLDRGADIEAKDEGEYTALHSAAFFGHKDLVRLLLDRGADIGAKTKAFYTALHCAVSYDQKDVVELLLGKGADIGAKTKDGCTALHSAASYGHKDVVELLLERGADKEVIDEHGKSALNYASEKGYKEIEEILLKK